MPESTLLPELIAESARRTPLGVAIGSGAAALDYGSLDLAMRQFASGMLALGLRRGDRVAIYLDKRVETVIASFGATGAGAVFVPINLILKPEQVVFILQDCNVRLLVTSREPLEVQGEWVFPVGGLPTPAGAHVDGFEQYPAVALFLQRARRAAPGARSALPG